MELRSKSQREAVGPDVADRDLSGEAVEAVEAVAKRSFHQAGS